MDHNRAIESQATERYLLMEMSPEERDEFEAHYFSCAVCAEDVRAAAQFHEDLRSQLASRRRPAGAAVEEKPKRSWWSWPQLVPAGAAVALAGVVIYLVGFQIPTLRQGGSGPLAAQPIVAVALHGSTRGEAERVPSGGQFFSVYFDVPAPANATSYDAEITSGGPDGKVAARVTGLTPKPNEPVNLLLPRVDFPAGTYAITVRQSKIVITQVNFIVE